MAKHVNPAQVRRITALHDEGYSLSAIAEQLGLDRHTVARHCGSRQERDTALAGLTPAVLQPLLKLAASVREFACPSCAKPVLRVLSQHEGWCPHCRRWWGMRDVKRAP